MEPEIWRGKHYIGKNYKRLNDHCLLGIDQDEKEFLISRVYAQFDLSDLKEIIKFARNHGLEIFIGGKSSYEPKYTSRIEFHKK